ncbi:hypothetical protein [Leuconostoc mesenteroides]|uniref:hypothetical protein n=1 Tax=Leuconostoc mesenteroides TaxID=1245 RepID=UPI0021A46662|nr:hypothetical protein [Leuconostoc mesenteroides]MCT3048473.1 hypothetical protein [Leuconostoc mesenteroides]
MIKKKYLLLVGLIVCGTMLVIIGALFIHTNHKTTISSSHSSISTTTSKKVTSSSSVSKATSSITSSSSTQQSSSYTPAVATSSSQQNNTTASTTESSGVSTDTNTLTGFINTYGMTPSAYKMKQGMSAEDALKAVPDTMKTSGEIQTEHLTYGIQSVADDGTVTMSK